MHHPISLPSLSLLTWRRLTAVIGSSTSQIPHSLFIVRVQHFCALASSQRTVFVYCSTVLIWPVSSEGQLRFFSYWLKVQVRSLWVTYVVWVKMISNDCWEFLVAFWAMSSIHCLWMFRLAYLTSLRIVKVFLSDKICCVFIVAWLWVWW